MIHKCAQNPLYTAAYTKHLITTEPLPMLMIAGVVLYQVTSQCTRCDCYTDTESILFYKDAQQVQ